MIKGEITAILRNAETGAEEGRSVVTNIITDEFYAAQNFYGYAGVGGTRLVEMFVAVSSQVMASTRFTTFQATDGGAAAPILRSSTIPSSPSGIDFFPANNANNPNIVQYSGRFLPPSSGTRTINTILLAAAYRPNYGGGAVNAMAFAKLNESCIQTDSQVLDIYYRLIFENDVNSTMPYWLYSEVIRRRTLPNSDANTMNSLDNEWRKHSFSMFPELKFKESARNLIAPCLMRAMSSDDSTSVQNPLFFTKSLDAQAENNRSIRPLSLNLDFNDNVGLLMSNVMSGGGFYNTYPHMTTQVKWNNKIQNLIGHKNTASPITATPFLDVDNLADGSGVVNLGGSWNNTTTPAVAGGYYQSQLPEWNEINITSNGQVGVASYRYTTSKFLGLTGNNRAPSAYTDVNLYALSATSNTDDIEYGRTLLGDITDAEFGTRRMSASIPYDDSSVIVVKRNKIILFGVMSSDYWTWDLGIDNHQVAVVQGKIYVACTVTGLWVIDPINNTNPVNLNQTYSGVSMTVCRGVSSGFNNTLVAVGADGIAIYDPTADTWLGYNPTVTWSTISHIKTDISSPTYQSILVHHHQESQVIGKWWSTASVVVTDSMNVTLSLQGAPALNKSHIGVMDGNWAFSYNRRFNFCNFGDSTVIADTVNYGNKSYTIAIGMSITWVKDPTNLPKLVDTRLSFGYNETIQALYQGGITLISPDGTAPSVIGSGWGFDYNTADFTSQSTLAYQDKVVRFLLTDGIMFTMNHVGTRIISSMSQYGVDLSLSGGPYSWLSRKQYGWNGSNWILGNTNSKITSSSVEPLLSGVTVRFTDGVSGTSFITPNYYKFGLYDGLLKDNATKVSIKIPFYFRRTEANIPLENSVIPATTTGHTGTTNIHPDFKSSLTSVVGNTVVFGGSNDSQYAVGNHQVMGDFEISFDVSQLDTIAQKTNTSFGIGKAHMENANGQPLYGFYLRDGMLAILHFNNTVPGYIWDNRTSDLASITSLKIRRNGTIIEALINDIVIHTMDSYTPITAGDKVLDILYSSAMTYDNTSPRQITNRSCPLATIVSNGSATFLKVGNSVAKTGVYHTRFNGIDLQYYDAQAATIDAVNALIHANDIDPNPGEISVAADMGIVYFNTADIGKPAQFNCLCLFSG